jgi:hypothetical protein
MSRLKEIIQEVNRVSGDWKDGLNNYSLQDLCGVDGNPFTIKNTRASYLDDESVVALLNKNLVFSSITAEEMDRLESRFGNDFGHDDYPPKRGDRVCRSTNALASAAAVVKRKAAELVAA